MEKETEKMIFAKMKSKDFGESMCNETKRKVLRWLMKEVLKNENYRTIKGELITYSGFTPTNKNHLKIEILGEENYVGNIMKIGDEIEIRHTPNN